MVRADECTDLASAVRLVLFDIDGTILPYGTKVVSERTRAAIHAVQAAGIHAGPASGRGFSHIPASFAGDAACSSTCLATNGMQVYLDGRLIHQSYIPREQVVRLAELTDGIEHAGTICFEEGRAVLVSGCVDDLEESFPLYAAEVDELRAVPDHDLEKVNVFIAGDMDATRAVFEQLRRRELEVGLNLPMVGFINVTPLGWSKADGIDLLCEALGITLQQVVVFGDGGNDVEMLAHVPNSVAVAGAAPEAAAAARWHIGECEDEAVAKVLEGLAAGRWLLS
ncbi:MAG: HAD family hydrolase [Coriobacteriales bacterium]|nr:HAD family hydrolase [Coriobacteriales bacterium]